MGECGVTEVSGRTESCRYLIGRLSVAWTCVSILMGSNFDHYMLCDFGLGNNEEASSFLCVKIFLLIVGIVHFSYVLWTLEESISRLLLFLENCS